MTVRQLRQQLAYCDDDAAVVLDFDDDQRIHHAQPITAVDVGTDGRIHLVGFERAWRPQLSISRVAAAKMYLRPDDPDAVDAETIER